MSIAPKSIRHSISDDEAKIILGFLHTVAFPTLNHDGELTAVGQRVCTTFGAWCHIEQEVATVRADRARRRALWMSVASGVVALLVAFSSAPWWGAGPVWVLGFMFTAAFGRREVAALRRAVHFKRLSTIAVNTLASSISRNSIHYHTRFPQ